MVDVNPPRHAGAWVAGQPLALGGRVAKIGDEVPEAWDWPLDVRAGHLRVGALGWRSYSSDAAIVAADAERVRAEVVVLVEQRDRLRAELEELGAQRDQIRRSILGLVEQVRSALEGPPRKR